MVAHDGIMMVMLTKNKEIGENWWDQMSKGTLKSIMVQLLSEDWRNFENQLLTVGSKMIHLQCLYGQETTQNTTR